MNIETRIKPSFSIIGKEGATTDGPGFIQALWADANAHLTDIFGIGDLLCAILHNKAIGLFVTDLKRPGLLKKVSCLRKALL